MVPGEYTPLLIVPAEIVPAVVPSVTSTPVPAALNVDPILWACVAAALTVNWTLLVME